ncbi:MAG: citrate transporter [Lachnospiraceae bacterium]|nr:citrate transporter [Lachnospiraceae bacterium]
MLETMTVLTPLHYLYLVGVIVILSVMILRKDTPAVCIAFLFLLGAAGVGSIFGGIQTIFSAMVYAAKEFMEVIATIALVTALSKCLSDLGSDYLLMRPMSHVMKNPSVTWWILGLTMLIFSLFLWPSPSVALVGAIMLPFAVGAGLKPLAAAMAMNLFGHGIALSYDVVIQGAPAISAGAAGISTSQILTEGRPVFLVMGAVTVTAAFMLQRKELSARPVPLLRDGAVREASATKDRIGNDTDRNVTTKTGNTEKEMDSTIRDDQARSSKAALAMAIATPLAFLADIAAMLLLDLKGGDATSLVSGTAVFLMCFGSLLAFRSASLEKVTGYLTDGFLFAIRIFAPVIAIGAFFFLGGEGISQIMGGREVAELLGSTTTGGIMNDWAVWLAGHAPLNRYLIAALLLAVGALTGLDGSGFSGLPLTGSLAHTLGTAVGASVPVLAALGQIAAIFVGGGTIVPWGLIPVAAICDVSPLELARKNLLPVLIGFLAAFAVACFLL